MKQRILVAEDDAAILTGLVDLTSAELLGAAIKPPFWRDQIDSPPRPVGVV